MSKRYIDIMNGYEFEEYCCDMLRAVGFQNVRQTKLSGDFGIDITAERNGKAFGIQCKRYSSPVGVHAVQEALSGAIYYKCNSAMVLSNQSFTEQARELARKTNVLLVKIDELYRIFQNTEIQAYTYIRPSKQDLSVLINAIFKAFQNHGLYIKFVDVELGCNETTFWIKKEDSVRLNKFYSMKNEIAFEIGKSFEIDVNYEKQCILLIFENKDISGRRIEIVPERREQKRIDASPKPENDLVDELFEKAGRIIMDNNRASIGILQRALQIGFNRANKIMNQLFQYGVVGEEDGMKPRKILMGRNEFEKLVEKLREEN